MDESTPSFEIELSALPTLNYAMAHNGVPVISRLTVRNMTSMSVDDAVVSVQIVNSESQLSQPWSRSAALAVGAETVLDSVELRADPTALLQVTEQRPGAIIASVSAQGHDTVTRRADIQVLAANQWLLASQVLDFELLCSFVMPNHPAINDALSGVSSRLEGHTGRAALDGYQAGAERVDEIVRSAFEEMQARGIRYAEPPASWSDVGQKIRTPDQVLDGRFGTCLDTVVVLAALLEQCGIRPLIWIADGHAFLGYWRYECSLAQIVDLDIPGIVNLVDLEQIGVIETTLTTDHADTASFAEAQRLPRQRWLSGNLHDVQAVIDVHQARRNGIIPLPARLRDPSGDTRIVQYVAADHSAPNIVITVGRSTAAATAASVDTPSRVQAWKNTLLDLSLRNRLINLPSERAAANLVVPEGRLGTIEDMLNAGTALRLLPATAFDGVHAARGAMVARDLPSDVLTSALAERNEVYTSLTADSYDARLRALAYKARTIEEDTGANNLYLAFGSLIWTLDRRELRSPLVLVPVMLKAAGRGGAYRLTIDDGGASTPNFCLLEKLRQCYDGLRLPALEEPELDDSGIDLNGVFDAVRITLAKAGLSARVEASADLAILQFAKFRLWKDLDENWQTFAQNPLVSHLIATPTEPFNDQTPEATAIDLDALAADLPVPADASQVNAVAQATNLRTFVLEGPPGTGKSQTITNLLANAVASGRRVLFVAEKRAALDVVHRRLTQIDMSVFALDLHDKSSKPSVVREQIKRALDHHVAVDEHGLHAEREELQSATRSLARYARRLHESNNAGLSLYSAHDRSLAYGDGPALDLPTALLTRPRDDVARLRDLLVRLPESADETRPRLGHPWGFLDSGTADEDAIEAIRLAAIWADQAVSLVSADPALSQILAAARTPEELATLARIVDHAAVPLETLDSTQSSPWQDAAARASKEIGMFGATAHPGLELVTPDVLDLPLADIHLRAQAAANSGFFGRKKRLGLVAAELAPALRPGTAVGPKQLLELTTSLLRLQQAAQDLAKRTGSVPGVVLPSAWNPLTAQAKESVDRELSWLTWAGRQIHDDMTPFHSALREFVSARATLPAPSAEAVQRLAASFTQLSAASGANSDAFACWVGQRSLLEQWSSSAPGRSLGDSRTSSLRRWVDFLRAIEPLRAACALAAREQLKSGAVNADDATQAFERGLAEMSERERTEQTGLGTFDAAAHARTVARFSRASSAVREHLRGDIPRRVLAGRPFSPDSGLGQVGALRRELAKQRRAMSVRKLLGTYGELIVAAMPCVLVSPESIARFFPAVEGLFDLVVFDEASQIRVADAIGAMGRARSVVVVGDSKQMPPTSFAEPSVGSDDIVDTDVLAVEDEESILSECVQARVPREWLSWHYRSQDESLIAFSNRNYYEDRLSSFPSPVSGRADPGVQGTGVSLVRVPGHFQRSGKGKSLRTNEVEARAVVDDIRRRFALEPDHAPSVGVVTFNAQQRALIEFLLRDLDDSRIAEALDDRTGGGLFVKNLENVQGDERDVILFSVAFSRNERGDLPLNFGPLNRSGGERRLNVAVTRARRQVVLYCSFDPSELRAEQTSSVGIKHLRLYLEFAAARSETKHVVFGARRSSTDRHREEIAAALRKRGLSVSVDAGLSDFRVDLSVALPDEPERPVAAILLDGPGWAARRTVGDRDGLPIDVLSRLMRWPVVERIWLPEWLADPEAVAERLTLRCRSASTAQPNAAEASTPAAEGMPTLTQSPPAASSGAEQLHTAQPVGASPLLKRSAMPAEATARVATRLAGEADFETFEALSVGPRHALDQLTDYATRIHVQHVITSVVQYEGPIERDRLARTVAGAFGLNRVAAGRVRDIVRLIPPSILSDEDGTFFWPQQLTPNAWTGFRRSSDYAARPIEEIALREIGNAMVALCSVAAGLPHDELLRESLRIFGGRRVTTAIGARLNAAIGLAVTQGRLTHGGDFIRSST